MSTNGPKENGTFGTNGHEPAGSAEMSTNGPKSNGTFGTNGREPAGSAEMSTNGPKANGTSRTKRRGGRVLSRKIDKGNFTDNHTENFVLIPRKGSLVFETLQNPFSGNLVF